MRGTILADRVFDGNQIRGRSIVTLADQRIIAVARAGETAVADITLPDGAMLAPGFIDCQVNGGGGVLLNDDPSPENIARIGAAHRQFGTTGFLPTLISDTRDRIATTIDTIAAAIAQGVPGVLGVHIEGPFLNPIRKGIHPAANIVEAQNSDIALLTRLGDRGKTLVTMAPESVPDGFIQALSTAGAIVSAGHTEAVPDEMAAAVDQGLTGVTHLYNAMTQLVSRAPGVVGVTLADPRLFAGIIADGYHVADTAVMVAYRAKGADRLMLVTDAMPSVGTDLTRFALLGQEIFVADGRCQNADGTLAGAAIDMAASVRHMVHRVGVPLVDALTMASATPARFLGLTDRKGRISPGADGDLVALTPDLHVLGTWIGGVYQTATPQN